MPRPITLFTGQWADLHLEELTRKASKWGYDGLELACWGDHFEVERALSIDSYVEEKIELLNNFGLKVFAISNHLVGQCVCDSIDHRHKNILPSRIWGDGNPEGVRQRAAKEMMQTARAARQLGVAVVNGFTGSSIWSNLYSFPPTTREDVDIGYKDFAERWLPILDVFHEMDMRFALEVHPTEIAYDIITAKRALDAVDGHPSFGFNFDPSHLVHQFVDPVAFIEEFPDRIFHVHVKDARLQLNGSTSILGSHLNFGDPRRGWDFVSIGRGDVELDPIIRALNRIGYEGPLSVEWEDSGMEREFGAQEALAYVRKVEFPPSQKSFEAAFSE